MQQAGCDCNLSCPGNIAAWKVKVGDEVAAGDSLAEVETDKATMDWESQVRSDGLLHAFCMAAQLARTASCAADSGPQQTPQYPLVQYECLEHGRS